MNKKELRKLFLGTRDNLSIEEQSEKSKIIIDTILNSQEYLNSKSIFVFISFKSEVFTHDFVKKALSDEKNVFVPYIDKDQKKMLISHLSSFDELQPGILGILEPDRDNLNIGDPNNLDLIITPGLVFDKTGNRIGYGAGYYDKFFDELVDIPLKVAVAYDFQVIDNVPTDEFDQKVDKIITEKLIYNTTVISQ